MAWPDDEDLQRDRQVLTLYAERRRPEAFAALAELYRPLIRRSLEHRLRDYRSWPRLDLEADDLVHDALLRLHEAFCRYEEPLSIERPRVWVWNSVTWTLESTLRTCARRDSREPLSIAMPGADENGGGCLRPSEHYPDCVTESPEEALEAGMRGVYLGKCIETLAERPREVVRLWSLGVTLKRIAQRLGYANLTGVDRVRRKAIEALRRCMFGKFGHASELEPEMEEA